MKQFVVLLARTEVQGTGSDYIKQTLAVNNQPLHIPQVLQLS